jgi:hypothetical protein
MSDDAIRKQLPCTLTEAEQLERGDELADTELLIDRLKAELKGQRKAAKLRLEGLEDKRLLLAKVVDTRTEERDVLCKWIDNFPQKCVQLIRQDTGEQIDVRAMDADDLQGDMDFNNGAPEPDDGFEDSAPDELRELAAASAADDGEAAPARKPKRGRKKEGGDGRVSA